MEAQLRRLGPNSKVKVLRIPKECRTKIWLAGRGTTCQIYTKSKYASRQHFSITYREQKYFISDLQSANGTYLNDEKLTEEKILSYGSIISVGVPSEMWYSPDCIVYTFEPYCELFTADNQQSLPKNDEVIEVKKSSGPELAPELENITVEIDPQPNHNQSSCPETKPQDSQVLGQSLDVDGSNIDIKKADPNKSSFSDVMLIEPSIESKKHPNSLKNESKPAKIRKLGDSETVDIIKYEEVSQAKTKFNDQKSELKQKEINSVDEDIFAYEALTQVDEPIKSESNLLNYSLTEEVIEISDSEEDWSPGIEPEGRRLSEDDEDDDLVILETIIKSKEPRKNDLPPVSFEMEDELSEIDRKWLGRLLKIKEENELIKENQEAQERVEDEQVEETREISLPIVPGRERANENQIRTNWSYEVEEVNINATIPPENEQVERTRETPMEVDEPETVKKSSDSAVDLNIIPCTVKLSRLSTADIESKITPAADLLPRVEVPKKIIKKVVPKKSVTFDLVPQIKYFEVPSRSKLTASEKGRLRFTRVIYNLCNWNTHWLEECKRVAPEKDPPICEERLRKIPKKFSCHSDYMVAFIPPMLLHLWIKIKEKWMNSGDSGFRQTVSCDSNEDYHAENLSVCKCTGLVQSVNAHRLLIREGHLVLLRLHQIYNPEITTPASEKYSKKLGYLVFGFVESKIYERFHNQPLHQSLAERCASVVGDLHVVKLNILIKKRPSFQIDKKKLIQLTVVHQISQEIRMFRGICFLPDSPLCAAILRPSRNECLLAEPPTKENLVFEGLLDDVQSGIVRKLSHGCSSMNSLLYSIFGAAGTGKGQVIIALILQLLFGDEWKYKRPKIIYCTQWSIPLDEMVVKLKTYRQTFNKPFSLVRVGPIREVKPEVRDLCASNLASSLRNSDKRNLRVREFDAEIEAIKKADVICTTCISAGTSKICSAFEKLALTDKNRKVICIIDEAMSCKETDSVIPLLLGITHLILVGDIYQLEPTFSGEKTHSLGLDMSLFWRIYKNFMNVPKELWPIFILKTQYRMNSSLSKFTSQLIYNTPLQKPVLSVPNRIENLKSHLLLVDRAPENVGNVEKEYREIRIVSQLVKAVKKLVKASAKNVFMRVAVITCDLKQTESLQSSLPKREFPEVEISSIQAFQGREFDVVTFVYDGRKILTSWLATALTRARCSLFIFTSETSINGSFFFQKIANEAEKNSFLKFVHPDMTVKEFEQLITTD